MKINIAEQRHGDGLDKAGALPSTHARRYSDEQTSIKKTNR